MMTVVDQDLQLCLPQEKSNEQILRDELNDCKLENEMLEQEQRKSADTIIALKEERFILKLEHNDTTSLLKKHIERLEVDLVKMKDEYTILLNKYMIGRDTIAKLEEIQAEKLLNTLDSHLQADTLQYYSIDFGSQTDTSRGVNNSSQTDVLRCVTSGSQTDIELSSTAVNAVATSKADTQTDRLAFRSSGVQTNPPNCVDQNSQTNTVTPSVTNSSQTSAMTYSNCTQTKRCIKSKTIETQTHSEENSKTVQPKVTANISTQTTIVNVEDNNNNYVSKNEFDELRKQLSEIISVEYITKEWSTNINSNSPPRSETYEIKNITTATQTDFKMDRETAISEHDEFIQIKYELKKLFDKFETNDNNNNSCRNFNLFNLFNKIEFFGFKSLSFDEFSFLHKKIIKHSVQHCLKYGGILETAMKGLSAWQRNSISDKYSIIHIIAIMEAMMRENNKGQQNLNVLKESIRNQLLCTENELTLDRIGDIRSHNTFADEYLEKILRMKVKY